MGHAKKESNRSLSVVTAENLLAAIGRLVDGAVSLGLATTDAVDV